MLSMPLATSSSPICVALILSTFELAQVAIPGPRTRLHGANGSHADGDGHLPTLPAPPFCGLAQRQVLLLPRAHPLRCAL